MQRADSRQAPARRVLLLGGAAIALTLACSSDKPAAPADCPDAAAPAAQVERFNLGRAGEDPAEKKDADWCRACVWSDSGFASCQRVYAGSGDEDREALRRRARAKACEDAGYPADACPDSKVIALLCKGDPPPRGTKTPGAALQNLYKKMTGGEPAGGADAASAPEGDAPSGAAEEEKPPAKAPANPPADAPVKAQ